MPDLSRRNALQALAFAPVIAAIGSAMPACAQEHSGQSSTLVVYFSRTGNTRVIAHQIQRAMSTDIFEIIPASPYPEDYRQTVEQARQETAAGFRPGLSATVEDLARYDMIYLGTPVWSMTAQPIIRPFLAEHDLSGNTIVPFITHGGYGTGSSLSVMAEHAAGARSWKPTRSAARSSKSQDGSPLPPCSRGPRDKTIRMILMFGPQCTSWVTFDTKCHLGPLSSCRLTPSSSWRQHACAAPISGPIVAPMKSPPHRRAGSVGDDASGSLYNK